MDVAGGRLQSSHWLPTQAFALRATPEMAYASGQIQMGIAGNQEQFSVHVLCTTPSGAHTVHTWHSSSPQVWKASRSSGKLTGHLAGEFIFRDTKLQAYDFRSESWTAIPIPGAKAWNDLPLPKVFQGYSYNRLDPFRYRHKVLVVGECQVGFVLLELEEEEEEGGHWKLLAWADSEQFANYGTPPSELFVETPLQGGDLVVLRSQLLDQPVAFHLKHRNWLEPPASVCRRLIVQSACIYNP